ncbi:MAG: ADP-ribosylglycohydrolase family protein [Clostridia bacterium]|nr:ADP-ribosylglycohydrolase family protein [Clostridia bacterium]
MKPQYDLIPEWEFYAAAAETEYLQCIEEGLDMEVYKDLFDAAYRLPQNEVKHKLGDALYAAVQNASPIAGYPYNEPSELNAIRPLCKPFPLTAFRIPDKTAMLDKLYGAWMGRVCGCMLGKSVEGIRTNDLHPFLKDTDNFPLHRYILHSDITDRHRRELSFPFDERIYVDQINGMPPDDDTNYTVMSQQLIEKHGRDFTALDVLQAWPYAQRRTSYCTAERVAYCNFMKGFVPPASAMYKNPYREWIGAQIRADYYGYINPGDPETAAAMAFRDASVSHVKNGIYGAMYVASMLAAAAVSDRIETIIECGLGQIPSTSRLYEAICRVLEDYRHGVDEATWVSKLHAQYDEAYGHYWAHTISNAVIVTAALLYGKGDYGRSICIAVENGFDTDCNAATVGSVLGMRGGIGCIDERWTAPFRDTLCTTLTGLSSLSIRTLAEKTLLHLPQ